MLNRDIDVWGRVVVAHDATQFEFECLISQTLVPMPLPIVVPLVADDKVRVSHWPEATHSAKQREICELVHINSATIPLSFANWNHVLRPINLKRCSHKALSSLVVT